MAGILIIEDDEAIAQLILLYLRQDHAPCSWANSAEAARQRLDAGESFDLILLDLGLPGMDGFTFLKQFRATSQTPVMIVSSRESDEDKIQGLGLGADGFVEKPFSPKVLAARVAALLRRTVHDSPSTIVIGPHILDLKTASLVSHGQTVPLRKKEWDLLLFLARHPGESFPPQRLYHEVWGQDYGDLATVAVHIQRLRRKLEADPGQPRFLLSSPGFGYRIVNGDKA